MVNTIKFSQMTAGGDLANNDQTPGLLSGANVLFNNPWTFLPPGSTADRPAPSAAINYRLRFNTDDQLYEYYDAVLGQWTQLQESFFTAGPFVTYTASVALPDAFNLGTLSNGILKQTVTTGVATPAIALLDTDYYGPGMSGYLEHPAGVKDVNGNIVEQWIGVANAVNYVSIINSISGQVPGIMAAGTDTNVGIVVVGKGTGGVGFITQNTSVPFNFYSGTNNQHTTNFAMANTATNRTATWQDSDGTVAWLSDVMNTVLSLTGTADQVLVNGTSGSPQVGNITLTLPQNIDPTANPIFNTLQLNGAEILDPNGNIVLAFGAISSPTSYITLYNGIDTGMVGPTFYGTSAADPNVNIGIQTKGTGSVFINTTSNIGLIFQTGTAYQHKTNFSFANTSNTVTATWQDSSGTVAYLSNIPSVTPAALTATPDTNVTITLGGTPSTALLQATSITLGWTGQLSLTRGGTNNSLTASAGGIVWSDATKLNILAGTATANQILLSGNAATPAWSTTTYPATNAINTIMYASSANVLGVITPVNSAVLVSSAGGVPSMSTTLPNMNIGTPTAGVLTNTTGGGGLRSFQIFTSGSAATYTKPANVTSILVEVIGGGGGGGGITATASTIGAAAGGGAGGYTRKYIAAASGTYTYTVGGGGAGGVGNANGTTGTASTFSTLTANGGVGGNGIAGVAASIASTAIGGAGGTATGGDINVQGSAGGYGFVTLTSSAAGKGGASILGGECAGQSATVANGIAGQNYGSGGGGALGGLGTVTQNGGAGATGVIIVWEFA